MNMGFTRLEMPPRFASHGGSSCFLEPASEGCIEQTSEGPLREARSGTCLGMPGREKGLGLKENKLPDCNDFIPYLLLSAIQKFTLFLSCRGSQSFSAVALRIAAESLNSLRVVSLWGVAAEGKPHVTEGNRSITTRL